jgi:undecaprenyl pyrophosphate synthase
MNLLNRIRTIRSLKPLRDPELPEVARSVAIILDGNARWARRRGLAIAAGHRAGTRALRRAVEASIDLGVETLTVYAFSTENWSRPREEVDLLMEIFSETIERELPDLVAQGVRVRFLGRRDRAPEGLRERMAALEEETRHNELPALAARVLGARLRRHVVAGLLARDAAGGAHRVRRAAASLRRSVGAHVAT